MSNKAFQFKEFKVEQDRCAMKIGTDGVLLGAWTSLMHEPESILDIGTGTGVIALMLAQRSSAQLIDALEIDENAYEQSVANFEASDWGDRLFCYHAAFDEFVEEMQEEEQYKLIVSNPPFYEPKPPLPLASPPKGKKISTARKFARFYDALPFSGLLEGVSKLLHPEGEFSTVIPYNEEDTFIKLAAGFELFPKKITRVKGTATSAIKRSLLSFGFHKIKPKEDELIIEISRHDYTPEYKALVKDFYLKM